jgi:hypothetical protein
MFDNAKLFAQALGIEKPWKLDEVKFDPKEGQLDIYIHIAAEKNYQTPIIENACIKSRLDILF